MGKYKEYNICEFNNEKHFLGDKVENLVTIVVPVYNVEKYIDRCVSSIINQTYKNLEIILVDDGSPDNCPHICDEWARRDPRIKVVHKQNAGLGMARNTGIENATGDYICFFDSDDYVSPNIIEKCLITALDANADMIIFGHDIRDAAGNIIVSNRPCSPKSLYCGDEITRDLLPLCFGNNRKINKECNLNLSSCFKFYSLDVIKNSNWRFVSEREIIAEDFYSVTKLFKSLDRVYVMDEIFYHYALNPNSLSCKYNPERFEKLKKYHKAMIELSEEMELGDVLEMPIKAVTLGLMIGAMKQIIKCNLSIDKSYLEIKKMINDDFLQALVRSIDRSHDGLQKELFYNAIKYKLTVLCYVFVFIKSRTTK